MFRSSILSLFLRPFHYSSSILLCSSSSSSAAAASSAPEPPHQSLFDIVSDMRKSASSSRKITTTEDSSSSSMSTQNNDTNKSQKKISMATKNNNSKRKIRQRKSRQLINQVANGQVEIGGYNNNNIFRSNNNNNLNNTEKRRSITNSNSLGLKDVTTVLPGILPLNSSSEFGQLYVFPFRNAWRETRHKYFPSFINNSFSSSFFNRSLLFLLIPGSILLFGLPYYFYFAPAAAEMNNNDKTKKNTLTTSSSKKLSSFLYLSFTTGTSALLMWSIATRFIVHQKRLNVAGLMMGISGIYFVLALPQIEKKCSLVWMKTTTHHVGEGYNNKVHNNKNQYHHHQSQSESKIDSSKYFDHHHHHQKQHQQQTGDAEPTTADDALYCVSLAHREKMYFGPQVHPVENLVVCATEKELFQKEQKLMMLINNNTVSSSEKQHRHDENRFFIPNIFESEGWGSRVSAIDALKTWTSFDDGITTFSSNNIEKGEEVRNHKSNEAEIIRASSVAASRPPTFFSMFLLSESLKTNEWNESFSTPYSSSRS